MLVEQAVFGLGWNRYNLGFNLSFPPQVHLRGNSSIYTLSSLILSCNLLGSSAGLAGHFEFLDNPFKLFHKLLVLPS